MMPDLSNLTTAELKQYLSTNRNDEKAFRAALQVLISRRNPANRQPYPFDLDNPESQIETFLREKFNEAEGQI